MSVLRLLIYINFTLSRLYLSISVMKFRTILCIQFQFISVDP